MFNLLKTSASTYSYSYSFTSTSAYSFVNKCYTAPFGVVDNNPFRIIKTALSPVSSISAPFSTSTSTIGLRKSDRYDKNDRKNDNKNNNNNQYTKARSSGDRSRGKYSSSSTSSTSPSTIKNKKLLHPISNSKDFKSYNKFTQNANLTPGKSPKVLKQPANKVIVEHPDEDVTVIQSKSTFVDGLNPEHSGTGAAFSRLGLASPLVQSLREMDITIPSTIQQLAIPEILSQRSDVLFVSQTGTGKTLSYLLPVFQNLKKSEQREKDEMDAEMRERKLQLEHQLREGGIDLQSQAKMGIGADKSITEASPKDRLPSRPRAIILVPTRELVKQVCQVTKQIAYHHKLSCTGISRGGGENAKHLKSFKERPIDIIVSTPGVLIQLIESKQIFFGYLEYLVVDEADSMFSNGKGFDEDMKKILAPIEYRLKNKNLPDYKTIYSVICSATLTEQLMLTIKSLFPSISKISTPFIHKSLNTLEQQFITVKGGDKHEALLRSVTPSKSKKILIFCNSPDSCRSTEYFLNENGFSVTSLHGDIPSKLRQSNWRDFSAGEKKILVCTDIASRGIDIKSVEHVILFDFPSNPIDYLHRIGRTARAGQKGVVTCIIGKKDQVLANAIQEALKRGDSLESLSSNKRLNKY